MSFSFLSFGQYDYQSNASKEYIYNGSKRYLASGDFTIGDLSINFGKVSRTTGVLLISISINSFILRNSLFPSRLGSSLYLFLENGKRLVLNKINSDNLDENILALYSINSTNLLNLSNSDIFQIRYSIVQQYGGSSNYTAVNESATLHSLEKEISQFEYENLDLFEKFDARIEYFPSDILIGKKYFKKYKYVTKSKLIETTRLVNNLFY